MKLILKHQAGKHPQSSHGSWAKGRLPNPRQSPAAHDKAAAKQLQPFLNTAVTNMAQARDQIDVELSGFNASGLKKAYNNAIQAGLDWDKGFNANKARAVLGKYYEGRGAPDRKTIAGQDFVRATSLRPVLDQSFTLLTKASHEIQTSLTGFNSPGLIAAFKKSIRAGNTGSVDQWLEVNR